MTGISDAITKPLTDFRRLFEALFEKTSPVFRGYVTVKLGDASKYEIDFSARIDDLVGPVFEQTATLQDASTVLVTIRNAIEGPIQLLAPPTATIQAKDAPPVSCQVHAPPPPPLFPLDLNAADKDARRPADLLQMVVASSARLVEGQYQVFVTTQHLVSSSGQQVLDAILDPEVESRFAKKVTVKIAAGAFTSNIATTPGPRLVAIEVSFERGSSASFEAPAANATETLLAQDVMIAQSIVVERSDPFPGRGSAGVARLVGGQVQ
jgi:hypothetical protein